MWFFLWGRGQVNWILMLVLIPVMSCPCSLDNFLLNWADAAKQICFKVWVFITITKVGLKTTTSRQRDVGIFFYDSFNSIFDWQSAAWILLDPPKKMMDFSWLPVPQVLTPAQQFGWVVQGSADCATRPTSTQSIAIGFSPLGGAVFYRATGTCCLSQIDWGTEKWQQPKQLI